MATTRGKAAAAAQMMAAAPHELARSARERSRLYGFLAAVYREEPSAALLRRIKEPRFSEALADAGVRLDKDFFERPEDELLLDLAVEYTRLFIGPGRHVSPHESVHRNGGGGLLWGAATAEVLSFIEACGFRYKSTYHGIPDHISVELEFMKEIVAREARARRRKDCRAVENILRIEAEFIDQHLARWAPVFCQKVIEEADLPFYGELAKLTVDFLDSENEEIERRAHNGGDVS
ncbi:MAG: molecular chaperone [Rhodospirillales bacterium]